MEETLCGRSQNLLFLKYKPLCKTAMYSPGGRHNIIYRLIKIRKSGKIYITVQTSGNK